MWPIHARAVADLSEKELRSIREFAKKRRFFLAPPLLIPLVRVAAREEEDLKHARKSPNTEIKNGSRLQFVLKAAPKARRRRGSRLFFRHPSDPANSKKV